MRTNTGFNGVRASPWRRATMCLVDQGSPAPARIERIDGRGAALRTNAPLRAGYAVTLSHPVAGTIAAQVGDIGPDLVELRFAAGAASVGFAMTAIAADLIGTG